MNHEIRFHDEIMTREHEVKFHSADDPATMRVGFAVRCRKCGSHVFAWLDMQNFKKVLDVKSVEQGVFKKLMKEWELQVPADCDDAKALNLTRFVHEC
jgi:hypothetical protein